MLTHVDVLAAEHFLNHRIDIPRSHQNSGGGMSVLVNAIQASLMRRYKVNVCSNISELVSPVCLVETCWFTSNIHDPDYLGVLEKRIQKFKAHKEETGINTILLCAELSLLRLLPRLQESLLETIDVVGVTVPYLWKLLNMIGVPPHGYLCDAIDPDLFRPAEKQMTVTAVGALKYIKNIDWIIEVFRLLEGKMKRTYLGSAGLWSTENREEDSELLTQIEEVTEEYYPNASSIEVAYHNAYAAFAVNDTWHDCSSRANEELLMSGVISIHGQHPLFDPRPGFTVKTPEEAVAKIAELTNDFTELPSPELHQKSRDWALENVSSPKFNEQFETLMRRFT